MEKKLTPIQTAIEKLKAREQTISWVEQNNLFGLDYSTKLGTYKDFVFDIRYDYEGNPSVKPENCGLWLTVYFCGSKIKSANGTMKGVTMSAEDYLKGFLLDYETDKQIQLLESLLPMEKEVIKKSNRDGVDMVADSKPFITASEYFIQTFKTDK